MQTPPHTRRTTSQPWRRAASVGDNARMESSPAGVRLDIWLWAARLYKTRSLAKRAVEGRKVDVNGAAAKPARLVRVGERLHVTRGVERLEIDVMALSEKRGPASVASTLYAETETGRVARLAARESARLLGMGYSQPPAKPDKRARRSLMKLIDG
jgi:ribosome-associated heat shock protein Hsp15